MVDIAVYSRRRATRNGRRIRVIHIRLRWWSAVCPSHRRVSSRSGMERVPVHVVHRQLLERYVSIISITTVLPGRLSYRGEYIEILFFFFFFLKKKVQWRMKGKKGSNAVG